MTPVLCLRGVTGLWLSGGGGEEDMMRGMAPVLLDQLTVVWLVSDEEGCTPPTALKSVIRGDQKKQVQTRTEN